MSFWRSPDDFFAVAKSRSLYSRVSAGGRPRERTLTATPPSRRTVSPALRAAPRTRRPSLTMSGSGWVLEEADGPPVLVDVDGVSRRSPPVPGHGLHVAAQRHEPACAGVRADVAHGHREAGRGVRERRIVRKGEVRLRHADREFVEADALELLDLLPRSGLEQDPVAAVDASHDRLDLSLDRVLEWIDRRELRRLLGGPDDRIGERRRSLAALHDRLVRLRRE